jgi:hypothetical protein
VIPKAAAQRKKPAPRKAPRSAPPKTHIPRSPRRNTSTSVMTVEDVCREALISQRAVYRLIQEGDLKGFWPTRGKVFIHVDDFSAWISKKLGRPVFYARVGDSWRPVAEPPERAERMALASEPARIPVIAPSESARKLVPAKRR